jgi:thioredoxin-like negative regulator of GroEL
MSIPTMTLFKAGQPSERMVGLRPKEALAEILDGLLAADPTEEDGNADGN